MRYLPKSALRAVGVLTAAAALARTANGQGVVRTPGAMMQRHQHIHSSHLEIVSEKHDRRCPVLPGSMGAVWSAVSQLSGDAPRIVS